VPKQQEQIQIPGLPIVLDIRSRRHHYLSWYLTVSGICLTELGNRHYFFVLY